MNMYDSNCLSKYPHAVVTIFYSCVTLINDPNRILQIIYNCVPNNPEFRKYLSIVCKKNKMIKKMMTNLYRLISEQIKR